MKIAYLSSKNTLPGAKNRRPDAFEHDQMMDCLRPAFLKEGLEIKSVAWDDQSHDWSNYSAAIIGTTWDYVGRENEFIQKLKDIESKTVLMNSTNIVEWNINKSYLKELQLKGAKIIPTVWLDDPNYKNITNCFQELSSEELDCEELVLKRQIGASGEGQFKIKKGEDIPSLNEPMMVQPFLSNILKEGELSFIFIDGKHSHTVLKRAAPGEYRIQTVYGGTEELITASQEDIHTAKSLLGKLNNTPMYARVDLLREENGALLLMELELIEPFLYPLQGSSLGTLIANSLSKKLNE